MTDKVNRDLTDKQKAFLHFLAHDDVKGNVKEAMRLAGYSENTRPADIYAALTDEIIEVANKLLAANSIKAVVKLVDLLDNPGQLGSDKIIAATKEILDRAGVIKKEQQTTQIKADAIFILPQKDGVVVDKGDSEE